MASGVFVEAQLKATVDLFRSAARMGEAHLATLKTSTLDSIVAQIGSISVLDLPMAGRLYAAGADSGFDTAGQSRVAAAIAERVSQQVVGRVRYYERCWCYNATPLLIDCILSSRQVEFRTTQLQSFV